MKRKRSIAVTFAVCCLTFLGGQFTHADSTAPSFTGKSDGDLKTRAAMPRGGLNVYQKTAVDNYLAGQVQPVGALRLIAIQVQFQDSLMGGQPGSIRPELHDSTYFANELKHLEQYFDGASRKNLTIQWEVTGKIYNLPENMSYYGEDEFEDVRVVEMMQSTIDSSDDDIDFSLFDTVMLIHAGAGQETDILDNSRVQIFSTFIDRVDIDFAFPDSTVYGLVTDDSLGGEPFLVDNFMVAPEDASQDGRIIGSLGIWAFITGSRLGLVPLFDSEPSGFPDSRGVGDFCLMSSGLFNAEGFIPAFPSAFNRVIAGWVDPVFVESDASYRLRDINSPTVDDTACLRIPITESEYFLVVNRVHDTNFDSLFTYTDFDTSFPANIIPGNTDSLGGAEFDWFVTDFTNPFIVHFDPNVGGNRRFVVTGSGVYIWHIDENVVRQNVAAGFLPNDFVSQKGVDLEEADSVQDLDTTNFPFSFGSHFDSYRAGNNVIFSPTTKPASLSNSLAPSGITVGDISAVDSFMTCTVQRSTAFTETRTRWQTAGSLQPPSPFNLDATGDLEVIVLADTGAVYAFKPDGTEFLDRDGDPATVVPYFVAPGAVWRGAPAFGDVDGPGDIELVAASESGAVYAWKESADTVGSAMIYQGAPIAAPPMLIDINGDLVNEIVVVEQMGDSLEIGFIDGTGTKVPPGDPAYQGLWPKTIQAQYCAPLAFGAPGVPGSDSEGVVIAWADTIRSLYGITYVPVRQRSGTGWESWEVTIDPRGELNAAFPPVSSPALADLDANGFDDVVVTIPDGRLAVYSRRQAAAPDSPQKEELHLVELRSPNPSAPSVGDVDGNGTTEIALWDETHFYLFENNGRLFTNWPQPFRQTELGDFPALTQEQPLAGPIMGDIDSDGRIDILFTRGDGGIHALHADGGAVSGFPRVAPFGAQATPAISDLDGDGELSLLVLGIVPLIATVDAVSDTIVTDNTMVLAIQSLPGSDAADQAFWTMYQQGLERHGRVTESNPLKQKSNVADANSFIVYPNPVRGSQLHARIILNASATVAVEIYNLEGERAVSEEFFWNNPSSVIQTPFDEAIDVSRLAPGVYLLRMSVKSDSGSEALVKTFAILR